MNDDSSDSDVALAMARYELAVDRGLTPNEAYREVISACPSAAKELADVLWTVDGIRVDTESVGATLPPASVVPTIHGFSELTFVGAGGYGDVYRAIDQTSGEEVAIKILREPRTREGAARRERFRRELQLLKRFTLPGMVTFYRSEEIGRQLFFTMHLCRGGDLQAAVPNDSTIPPREAAEFIRYLSETLGVLHLAQVVHRDLKPSNILFDEPPRDGRLRAAGPRIADLGLARIMDDPADTSRSGQFHGNYMCAVPEQIRGEKAEPPADVYALGVILYRLLAGRLPFPSALPLIGPGPHDLPAPLPRTVDADLATVVIRCLAYHPARRFSTANELASDLRQYLSGKPIVSRPYGRLELGWMSVRRHPAVSGTIATLILAGAVVIGLQYRNASLLRAESAKTSDAYSQFFDGAVENLLAGQKSLNAEQTELLQKPLAFFRDRAAKGRDSRELAGAAQRVGQIHSKLGQIEPALAAFAEADAVWQALDANSLLKDDDRRHWIKVMLDRASTLADYRRAPEAVPILRIALDRSGSTTAIADRRLRARILTNLALAVAMDGGANAAAQEVEYLEAAHGEFEAVIADSPAERAVILEYSRMLGNLGYVHYNARKDFVKANELYTKATEFADRLTAPLSIEEKIHKSQTALDFHALKVTLHEFEAAAKYGQDAVATFGSLASDYPQVPKYSLRLGAALVNVGVGVTERASLMKQGPERLRTLQESLDRYDEAIKMFESLARRPDVPTDSLKFLGNVHYNRANSLCQMKRYADSVANYELAVTYRPDIKYGVDLMRLGALAASGPPAPPLAEVERLVAANPNNSGYWLLARAYSLAAGNISTDKPDGEAYAVKSLATLRKAHELKYPFTLQQADNTDFDAVRTRKDFLAFMDEIKTKK